MDNKEIAAAFKLAAALMELHGENDFRIRSYRNAYNALRKTERPLAEMSADEIKGIPGVGKSSAEKIEELITTGKMTKLEGYLDKTPAGVVEILGIRGIGPSKVRTIWKEMGIESPGELLYACNENRLIEASGFGLKTQADVKGKLEYHLASRDKFLYARAEHYASEMITVLYECGAEKADPVGEIARKCPVVHSLEIIVTGTDDGRLESNPRLKQMDNGTWVLDDSVHFAIHHATADSYVANRFQLTGSEGFVAGIEIPAGAVSDKEILEHNGLPYVIPELREDREVINRVRAVDEYVQLDDIKGIVHNHSTYSDGLHSLRVMAEYVRDSGYGYLGISDHSKTAVYANGLSVDRVMEQHLEIDQLNDELAPFVILKGIESDILADGSLDYEDDMLASFDFVVASVHSGLKMDIEKATNRLIRAIENPYTDILGHPTGRLLLSREGYPIDHKAVIDACAAHGVAIELNANPLRLDMDYTWIPYALESGVRIAINPDAHSKEGIHNVRFGVYAARKGGLTSDMCLNSMDVHEFRKWLQTRRIR